MVEFLSFNLVPLFFLVVNLVFIVSGCQFLSRNYTFLYPRLNGKIRDLGGMFIHCTARLDTFRSWFIFAEIVLLNVDGVDQCSCLFHILEFLGGITPFTVFVEIATPCF